MIRQNDEKVLKLKNLGLNSNQAKTYLALMELGKGNVIEISRKSGVNRTTVYENLRILNAKHLVGIGGENGKKIFTAESPNELKNLINEQVSSTSSLISDLFNVYNANPQRPKIKFYEAQEGFRKLHELSLIANMNRRTRYLGDIQTLFLALPETFVKKYVSQRIKLGIRNEVLTTMNIGLQKELYTQEKNRQSLRKIKCLPKIGPIKTALFTYDDVVWILPTPGQNFVLSIENIEFAETVNHIFESLWLIAEDIN